VSWHHEVIDRISARHDIQPRAHRQTSTTAGQGARRGSTAADAGNDEARVDPVLPAPARASKVTNPNEESNEMRVRDQFTTVAPDVSTAQELHYGSAS